MGCKEHPDYTATTIPRSLCVACWGLYFKTNTVSFDEIMDRSYIKDERAEWLLEHKQEIEAAQKERATATFESKGQMIDPKDYVKPVSGERI